LSVDDGLELVFLSSSLGDGLLSNNLFFGVGDLFLAKVSGLIGENVCKSNLLNLLAVTEDIF